LDSRDRNNRNGLWHYNDSSNSPYHNQPTYNPYRKTAFAVASLAMGALSVLSACTLIPPIPLGALGIIFAVMAYRKGKKTHYMAKVGSILSGIGVFISMLLVVAYVIMLPTLMRIETFRTRMNRSSQQIYGKDFDEMIMELYGIDINGY
jgi:hypothetical protein